MNGGGTLLAVGELASEKTSKCNPEKIAMRKGGHFVPDAKWYDRAMKMAHEELIEGLY